MITLNPDTNMWVTSKGNKASMDEVMYSLAAKAETLAWPLFENRDINGDLTGGSSYLGECPVFGEKRTLEMLEMLIDAAPMLEMLIDAAPTASPQQPKPLEEKE